MGDLTIRSVGLEDASILGSLIRGFRDHLAASTPTDAELQHHLPRALDDLQIEFCCAWLSERAVGYTQTRFLTSIWAPGIEAHLEDLFVVASARTRGVGRSLLRHALARARARGARRFSLNTNEANGVAQSLYRSEGLSPQSHSLYPGGREVLWVKDLHAA
jgi:ribosomal protein S18 acetylase RimI-like enzyme